jgi:hypothetical protein
MRIAATKVSKSTRTSKILLPTVRTVIQQTSHYWLSVSYPPNKTKVLNDSSRDTDTLKPSHKICFILASKRAPTRKEMPTYLSGATTTITPEYLVSYLSQPRNLTRSRARVVTKQSCRPPWPIARHCTLVHGARYPLSRHTCTVHPARSTQCDRFGRLQLCSKPGIFALVVVGSERPCATCRAPKRGGDFRNLGQDQGDLCSKEDET